MPSWYSTRTWNLWGLWALELPLMERHPARKPVEVGRLFHYLQAFIHLRWLALGFLNHPQYPIWAILPTANSWRPMKIGLIHPQKKERIISQPSFFQGTFLLFICFCIWFQKVQNWTRKKKAQWMGVGSCFGRKVTKRIIWYETKSTTRTVFLFNDDFSSLQNKTIRSFLNK